MFAGYQVRLRSAAAEWFAAWGVWVVLGWCGQRGGRSCLALVGCAAAALVVLAVQ